MKRAGALLLLLCALVTDQAGAAGGLVTELTKEYVDITARFAGENMLIFGAISRPGDVIIKMVSPQEVVDLSRKKRFGPLWLTADKVRVKGTAGLLYVLSNKPVDQLLDRRERELYGLDLIDGLSDAVVEPTPPVGWKQAFLRLKRKSSFYMQHGHAVKLVDNLLYSATLSLPTKLPLGAYRLEIYRVHNGRVRGHQERTFQVREVTLEHWTSDVAHRHPWIFGIAFTSMALTVGLVLGVSLRRGSDR